MNVLIAGGFWAIAKFMVLLCGTVILIIKSIYVYQKKYQKWTVFTRILYVMTMGGFEIGIVIVMEGVTGIFTKNWDIVVMMLMIFSGIIGGMLQPGRKRKEPDHHRYFDMGKHRQQSRIQNRRTRNILQRENRERRQERSLRLPDK